LISKLHSWHLTAVTSAILLAISVQPAQALSLGQISVRSVLGEPLAAEIDILDINADEAGTLITKVASPDAFKLAGLDYNAALSNLRATLQKRPNGRPYIKLSGDRPVNDPYVDMILEASWNTGKIVRDYTLLFDPPNFRAPATATGAVAPAALPQTGKSASAAVGARATVPVAPATAGAKSSTKAAPAAAAQSTEESPRQIRVKPGDTAGSVAASHKPANVSLDQMLVAMLRTSPDAFINNNVNRFKAGAVVQLPTEAQASETPAAEASQIIVAQSQDFNAFRRNLASNAPATNVTPASRQASGKVQAQVEDKKTPVTPADKLTLSKGAVTSAAAEKLAQERNAKEAADRAAEVAKNLKDLSKIAAASATSAPVSAPVAASASPAASNAATAAASALPTPKVNTPTVSPAPAPTPASTTEPSFIDSLLENPWVPAGAVGLIALLAGLGIYRRKRQQAEPDSSMFRESKIPPESFFGVSGGRNVDTNDASIVGSSMIYSPSQLDAVDDVDPVAEADVYLAYGRDLQAEEILKDALRTSPDRLAIHQKLLEIYGKRRDAKAYESMATLVFSLTNGVGSEWEHICEKGLTLEPDNALYLPGGQPNTDFHSTLNQIDGDAATAKANPQSQTAAAAAIHAELDNLDLDLDLDFSLDDPQLTEHTGAGDLGDEPELTVQPSDSAYPAADLIEPFAPTENELPALELTEADAHSSGHVPLSVDSVIGEPDFDLGLEDPLEHSRSAPLEASSEAAPPAPDAPSSDFMNLDLGSLALDFTPTGSQGLPEFKPTGSQALSPAEEVGQITLDELDQDPITEPSDYPEVTGDPLETKLALADEFRAIGDEDGARALIEEVLAEATGDVKARAQRAFSQL